MRTAGYTLIALVAFASNSVLCRLALKDGAIDPAGFTVVRLLSGMAVFVIMLAFSVNTTEQKTEEQTGSWIATVMLFVYAITFSFAYVSLDTGTGALVLFGAVQLTMVLYSAIKGYRLHIIEWVGISVAFAGLVYLMLPVVTTPSVMGFILMGLAGIAWGIYSLIGRGSTNALRDTASNFKRTLPLVVLLALIAIPFMSFSVRGFLLAVLSGALASGVGYTIWYLALAGLSASEAAVVQLSVPVIAAAGGVLIVSEPLSARMVYAGLLILGGILLVVMRKLYIDRLSSD